RPTAASSTRDRRRPPPPSAGEVQPGHAWRVETEDLAVERQLRREGRADVLRLAEPVLLARERQVRVRYPTPLDALEEAFTLRGRADGVLEALHQQEGGGDGIDVLDRGAFAVPVRGSRPGADQAVQVPRLEVVRLAAEADEVQDRVLDRPAPVHVDRHE